MKRGTCVLLVICLAGLSAAGCGKRRQETEPQVTERPAGPEAEGFDVGDGGRGGVQGGDIALAERPADMEAFRDPGEGGSGAADAEGGAQDVLPAGASEALQDVHFEYDSYQLPPRARENLTRAGTWLRSNPGVDLVIEGHCDVRGTAAYNLVLGEKRALAVREFLAGMKVAPARMTTVSFGEERPLDPRHTEEAWAANRRAHFRARGP